MGRSSEFGCLSRAGGDDKQFLISWRNLRVITKVCDLLGLSGRKTLFLYLLRFRIGGPHVKLIKDRLAREKTKFIDINTWDLTENVAQKGS